MRRRGFLTAAGALALGGAAGTVALGGGQPGYRVSVEQLQQALARRFPRRYPVGGMLHLDVQPPRLRLLPELNRLGTTTTVEAAGPALGRSYGGEFDLDFALRYEATDRTLRAHHLRVNSLRFADLPPGPAELLSAYGPTLAQQTLHEVVLHQLRPQDLALSDGLGLEPGSITVTDKGLVIGFVAKQP